MQFSWARWRSLPQGVGLRVGRALAAVAWPDLEPVVLPPVSTPALAVGALALGALAIGALAIGALAIGRLEIRQARLRKVEIDELTVRRFRVVETPEPGHEPRLIS